MPRRGTSGPRAGEATSRRQPAWVPHAPWARRNAAPGCLERAADSTPNWGPTSFDEPRLQAMATWANRKPSQSSQARTPCAAGSAAVGAATGAPCAPNATPAVQTASRSTPAPRQTGQRQTTAGSFRHAQSFRLTAKPMGLSLHILTLRSGLVRAGSVILPTSWWCTPNTTQRSAAQLPAQHEPDDRS